MAQTSSSAVLEPSAPASPPRRQAPRVDPITARERRFGRKLVTPALVLAALITQIPFLFTIYYSFRSWNLARPKQQEWAGFSNYVDIFTKSDFISSLWATVKITGSSVVLSVVFGLGLALLLNRAFRGRAVARTLLITPFLVMPAAAALIWKWSLLDADTGMVNWFLSLLGAGPVSWNTDFPSGTVIAVLTWQYTPFMMLIILAGLQSQSAETLEAASVDGAGPMAVFRHITLPHLRPYVELATVLGAVLLIQVFDPVAIMTRGTGGSKTLSYLLYERAFVGLEIGQAAALGVVTVLVTIIVASVALRTLFKVFSAEEGR